VWGDRCSIWLTGVMLGVACWLILALLTFILVQGLGAFWPRPLWHVRTADGQEYLGLIHASEPIEGAAAGQPRRWRTLLRVGNRDLSGQGFVWIDHDDIVSQTRAEESVVLERLEWGPFYGVLSEVRTPDGVVQDPAMAWQVLQEHRPAASRRLSAIRHLERRAIGDINAAMERHRLALRRLALHGVLATPDGQRGGQRHQQALQGLQARYEELAQELAARRSADAAFRAVFTAVGGESSDMPLSAVVRIHRPNQLSWAGKMLVYLDRLREFIVEEPREANSEGGVAPAIFGTVLMTLLMALAAVPLGVMAALYLHEYARPGPMVSTVRIAVNNLAGVPSIVFGVFGLGFLCYLIGGTLDELLFSERLPTPTFGGGGILWASLTLALLTVPVVIVATEEALAAVPKGQREASFACGANKFQTIRKIVLPAALPGILTGMILAMARGAGEVAPLMITGVVKLAPELPLDHLPPFLHLERRFMHLGFHIYDVGFQSPDVEASKPMVYMTTLLLLAIVCCLNVAAMQIRARLRRRFQPAKV
jgi:phosphate transport system permease protein